MPWENDYNLIFWQFTHICIKYITRVMANFFGLLEASNIYLFILIALYNPCFTQTKYCLRSAVADDSDNSELTVMAVIQDKQMK